ncbi:MAG: lactoylglutathione lyase [Pseudomonadota bacterium]
MTVSNMARAYEFYTEVLGGTEVLRDGDFQGAAIQNTLMQVNENDARMSGVNPLSAGVPDLRGGDQRLDVVFIQFDNVVIELLQYRDAQQMPWTEGTFAAPRRETSPAFPTSMHISFDVDPEADFDAFIRDLELASASRGMTNVRCNRNTDAPDDRARADAALESYALEISEGASDGWALAYCKGPEGEQLEFNQVRAPIDALFGNALAGRAAN